MNATILVFSRHLSNLPLKYIRVYNYRRLFFFPRIANPQNEISDSYLVVEYGLILLLLIVPVRQSRLGVAWNRCCLTLCFLLKILIYHQSILIIVFKSSIISPGVN
ncbi:hypothetical protein L1987_37053 [Smallanthus sonchifolius]|uniref:Uncharacterized protein n=1 Tax=Smallanthus sonchifolius TaxID=185202 RepID=A0ACB9HF97_9ASTR|nr:hypothetical protein L1987_37053 [Smallanthus sonchifolius]